EDRRAPEVRAALGPREVRRPAGGPPPRPRGQGRGGAARLTPDGSARRHRPEELRVVLRLVEALDEELHRLHRRERVENLTEDPHAVELLLIEEELFLARARTVEVDGREDTAVDELAVEVDLHVAGPLELLEDHVVHARARVDEGRRDDRERAALLDVPGGSEEALRLLERVCVHAARQHLAGGRQRRVGGPREPRDRVEKDDAVALVLDEPLRLL